MWNVDDRRPRPPRAEPEILPPEQPDSRRRGPERVWVRQRIYIARPSPVATALALVVLAALGLVTTFALVGFALLLIPAVALALGAFIIAALIRGPRRF